MVAVALAGPMDYLRPYDKFAGDQQKLLEQIEKDKAAREGRPPPLVPPGEGDAAEEEEAEAPQQQATPDAEPSSATTSSALQRSKVAAAVGGLRIGPINLGTGSAGLTLVAAAGFGAHRVWSARVEKALEADLEGECAAIRELTLAKRVDRPSDGSKRAALAELRARRALLEESVLPKLRTLEQPVDGPSKKPLGSRTSEELEQLDASLAERVSACALVLAEYERLGQSPPPNFRQWPLADLNTRLDNMKSKGAQLRTIATLHAKLGGKRMDWSTPDKSVTELAAQIETLETQVAESQERKTTQELLGKIEAELWRRKEEAPVALATLSIAQLEELLRKLKTGGGGDAGANLEAEAAAKLQK